MLAPAGNLLLLAATKTLGEEDPQINFICCFFLENWLEETVHFFRRHRYVFGFLAVLVLCNILVLRQLDANQSAHVEMREDFILLHDKGENKATEHFYQLLVQQLPKLSDKALLDDYQRTVLLVDPKIQQPDNLVWKFHWAVRQHLNSRAEARLARALRLAQNHE